MNTQPIMLEKAANGWIVQLPYSYLPIVSSDPWTDPSYVKKVVGLMKKEYSKDEVLEAAGVYDKCEIGAPDLNPEPVQQKEQNNIYIFSTYDEASAFIKERYDK